MYTKNWSIYNRCLVHNKQPRFLEPSKRREKFYSIDTSRPLPMSIFGKTRSWPNMEDIFSLPVK